VNSSNADELTELGLKLQYHDVPYRQLWKKKLRAGEPEEIGNAVLQAQINRIPV
jgi:hypothetical protein